MNHIHRLVFNASTNTWVAVAENACGRGKGSSRKLVAAALSLAVGLAQAAPMGGTVTSGAGSISQTGVTTTILQTTPNLSLNWKSFNIGTSESVKFVQPSSSSVAVNRIYDTQGSQILGRLSANGQVYLINPNGLLFGKDAVVNVAGLHASTQTLNNTGTGSATAYGPGSIINSGTITALNGGFVTLQADTVTNTGLISAHTVGTQTGRIMLLGNMRNGTVNVGGTLDASAPNGGNGGFIETSAASVKIGNAAQVITSARLGTTGTWLIDPTDFTIGAGSAPLSTSGIGADKLSASLSTTSINIVTSAVTTGTELGDIHVNAPVSWSANTLTLKADNNIYINARMAGSGTAKLALEYGQGKVITGNTSDYFVKAPVDLPAGLNFSTKLGLGGTVKVYTVITTLGKASSLSGTDLQGIEGALGTNFALGQDIAAAETVNWNGGQGFRPISLFNATFEGLGHVINGLTINRPSAAQTGLFGAVGVFAEFKNVGLVGGRVVGYASTGGLLGYSSTGSFLVNNVYNTGSVSGRDGTGGLVGYSKGGTIVNSYATGPVSGDSQVGGLLGVATTGSVSDSYATGNVTGTATQVGGLVGATTSGTVTNSWATGNVSAMSQLGGLIGNTTGAVTLSYATGNVTGTSQLGGLVGNTTSPVSLSYATGNVSGTSQLGGLVGNTTGPVSLSYATGNVSGTTQVGGLVGNTSSTINDSYAMGAISGAVNSTGGLVGNSTNSMTNVYAAGASTGTTAGLAGATTGAVVASYWDGSVGPLVSVGGGVASQTAPMKQEINFTSSTSANGNTTPKWDFTNTWYIVEGTTYPLLRALKPTVAPTSAPTVAPTSAPTVAPTSAPTVAPTSAPTVAPTSAPTVAPTSAPTVAPTSAPTVAPTSAPTVAPTAPPSVSPTWAPTPAPTLMPTVAPTFAPTVAPTAAPTLAPTVAPTVAPTSAPTTPPTVAPTAAPSMEPTASPTAAPTVLPTVAPTSAPTAAPTFAPTVAPTAAPTSAPTVAPTSAPTAAPTVAPTAAPSMEPTASPTSAPTVPPTAAPTPAPTTAPSTDALEIQTRASVNTDLNCRAASGSSTTAKLAKVLANKENGLPDTNFCAVENESLPESKRVTP
jgi:filamentous hemagglutinin family protein